MALGVDGCCGVAEFAVRVGQPVEEGAEDGVGHGPIVGRRRDTGGMRAIRTEKSLYAEGGHGRGREVSRCGGVLGPRASWLAGLVAGGAIRPHAGYLRRSIRDPFTGEWIDAREDRLKCMREPDPRERRRYGR